MEIVKNTSRVGFFTSSRIGDLMTVGKDRKSFGAPALNLIREKNMEIKLGRSLNTETSSKPTAWGNLVEQRVFELLGTEYRGLFMETFRHQNIAHWSGSPDALKYDEGQTVVDIKSPFALKSFCDLADCKNIDEVRANHKEGNAYYWQIVSNAILTGSIYGELIVYCPYQSELESIRDLARNWDGNNQNDFAFINWASDNELPYLIEGKHYKNLNVIRWEIDQSDKDLLTETIIVAGNLLYHSFY